MLQKILTNKEFKEIYDHCRLCKGSYAIKDFIEDIFKEFGSSNTNLTLTLMEFIESQYPALQGRQDLANNNYLNFKEEEELNNIKEPSIEYLYSFLIYLTENKKTNFRGNGDDDEQEKIFKTHLDAKKLETVFNGLREKGYCKFSSFESVQWIFFESKDETKFEKICWIDQNIKNKDTNYQTLLFLLEQIVSDFNLLDRGQTKRAIIGRFNNSSSKEFHENNFKSVIQRYNKNKKDRKLSPSFKKILVFLQ